MRKMGSSCFCIRMIASDWVYNEYIAALRLVTREACVSVAIAVGLSGVCCRIGAILSTYVCLPNKYPSFHGCLRAVFLHAHSSCSLFKITLHDFYKFILIVIDFIERI